MKKVDKTLSLLDRHYESFFSVVNIARETGHPVPTDTRGWSQIVVSTLTGIRGVQRKKGADLEDGSDVKGANTWEAIDTPRFNGVIKSGTQAAHSDSITYLDSMPFLFFVLWDITRIERYRCRIWVVRPRADRTFRSMCNAWYEAREEGRIKSNNFQLHPPRGVDTNNFRNTFGNLSYPLLFSAVRRDKKFEIVEYQKEELESGLCVPT